MTDKPQAGLANILLVWVIGLLLGAVAGTAAAMLLIPAHGNAGQTTASSPVSTG